MLAGYEASIDASNLFSGSARPGGGTVLAGESCRKVEATFKLSVAAVVKWSQRARRTGSVAPGKMGGHRRPILEPHREFVLARLKDRPETTLLEMRELLVAERGVRVSLDTIWRFLRAERQTYKKRPAGERDRAA